MTGIASGSRQLPHEQGVFHAGERLTRLYRFMRDHGPVGRDRIMHCCDFPSPKSHPVIAYVEFTNAVMRLDLILRRHGRGVEGGVDTGEVYRLVGGGQ